jgi:DNA end-binding protein Ku
MKHKGRVAWPASSLQTIKTSLREPWDKGMLGTRSRFDYEVRDEKEFFKAIATHRKPKEMVSLAAHILDTKPTTPILPSSRRKLVKRKAAGKPMQAPEENEHPSNVIDLMEVPPRRRTWSSS